jgi:hypothetical protein
MNKKIIKELQEFRELVAFYEKHAFDDYGQDVSDVRRKINRQTPRIKKFIKEAKIPTQISGRAPIAMGGTPFTMDIFDDMFLNERTPLAVDLNNTLDAIDKCIGIIKASSVEDSVIQKKEQYDCGPLGNLSCNQRDFIEKEYKDEKIFLDIPYDGYKVREKIIKEVVSKADLIPVVTKELLTSNAVLCKVCKIIQSCKYGVSDISFSRHSVTYELGLMHGFGFKACILLQESIDKFSDVEGLEHTSYGGEVELRLKIAGWLLHNIPEVNKDKLEKYIKEQEKKISEVGDVPFASPVVKKKQEDEFKREKVASKEFSDKILEQIVAERKKQKTFLLSATPIPLEDEILDTNEEKVKKVFLEPEYSRGSGWDMGYSSFGSNLKPNFEGIEKTSGDWKVRLFRSGYLEFSAEVNISFSWSQNEEEYKVSPRFNPYAVTEFPASFIKLLKQLVEEFDLTKAYIIKMAYFNCGKYKLRPYSTSSIAYMLPGSEKEANLDRWVCEKFVEDLDFETDKEAHSLVLRLYNTFGFTDEEIPFFDDEQHFTIPSP